MISFKQLVRLASLSLALIAVPALAADESPHIVAMKIAGKGAIIDPGAPFWKKAPATMVAMLPQTVALPNNAEPAISTLSVRAVHNGEFLAFLIEWDDASKNDRIVVQDFGDQVAVELPVRYQPDNPPNVMMGGPDGMVTIMQWRAAFQRDLDQGAPKTINDLYPNAHTDVYPDQVLLTTDAISYMGALTMGNPVSRALRSPVLDQMAEGFGTLTVKPQQSAVGKGVWSNGKWHVVIARPLHAASLVDPDLQPGAETLAAFAVWDGGAKEVGARKAWADWVPLTLAK
jgi:DMSO reductase family type II enzyme heme b subunit